MSADRKYLMTVAIVFTLLVVGRVALVPVLILALALLAWVYVHVNNTR